ncbi:MAG: altronate dehydratase [Verrucomicrobiales bacterium]|nr:altronate dehydratase [Verrucomicrobiales bacterium]
MSRPILRIHPADDAIVALRPLAAGQTVTLEGLSWTLPGAVAAKHKFAARDFSAGEWVTMYGVTVGRARRGIAAGEWLSTENLEHASGAFTGKQAAVSWTPPEVSRWQGRTFEGFRRSHGVAGTANYWIVLPLVFCESRNVAMMREALTRGLGYAVSSPYERYVEGLRQAHAHAGAGIEVSLAEVVEARPYFSRMSGVAFLDHGLGCGGTRQDALALCRLLAGYLAHPNVAGATVLSLGCQNAQVSLLEQELARWDPAFDKPLHIFEQQKSKSEREMIAEALRATFDGMAEANEQEREAFPLSDLILGVECGGSDGFSGISANPAIGHASDLLAALGGAPVLAEFPELCGVEQSLCDRCVTAELADRFVELMRAYEAAAQACGSSMSANPSPGNIRDGLITDAIKSAGAAKKGGTGPVVGVIDYAEPVTARGGLTLCCTPGNDVESTTALAAAGCNVMLFSTGMGTPTGNPVCPVLKISSNTDLARRLPDLIDFDAGPILTGEMTVEQAGEALLEQVIETASGRYTARAVALGQNDFLPWKRGVSL